MKFLLDSLNTFEDKSQVDYWVKIIREHRDPFRKFVSDPALYSKIKEFDPGSLVLDCGCGEGYVSRELCNGGHKAIGIDLSRNMIKAAKDNEGYFSVANIFNIPFADETFDNVISNFVLLELKEPERAIKEISRVLKKNGKFIFQISHPFSITSNSGKPVERKLEDYFESKLYEEKFIVDGLTSPKEGIRYHHPLSRYTQALRDNSLLIESLEEPRPIKDTPKGHSIRKIFKEPWVLLIEAIKA